MLFIGFDTETYLIEPGVLAPRLVCLTASTSEGVGDPVLFDAAAGVAWFWDALTAGDVVLVAHNAAYDLAVVCAAADRFPGPWTGGAMLREVFRALDGGRVRDTMVREKLLAIADDRLDFDPVTRKPSAFSLAALVSNYFGVDLSAEKTDPNAWRLRYSELEGVPTGMWPAAARDYAIADAVWALDVFKAQGAHPRVVGGATVVDEDGNVTDEGPQTAAAFVLHLLSCWGVRTDPEAVAAWSERVDAEVAEGYAIGRKAGFVREDGTTSTAALRDRVVAAYGSRGGVPGTTPKGAVSTDRDTLENSGDPVLLAYAAAGFAKKEKSTYMEPAIAGTKAPINAGYNVLVATGRTSCFKPNLQNPPRAGGYRGCFVPRPGYLFCSVDYDTAELRALAQFHVWWFGQSAMADAIRSGLDLHLVLGAAILGTTYADALARKKDPEVKRARQLAKVGNFGFPGGLLAASLVDYARGSGVILTLPEAHALRDAWFQAWPEMRQYFDRISRATEFGPFALVQAQSGRVRGGTRFTQACNGYFQGLVADWAKAALWAVSHACYTGRDADDPDEVPPGGASPLLGCRPVLFLHDEIIAEVPEERADQCAREMARVMVAAAQPYAPDVPITASPALMRRWHKGAESVYNAHGLLVPWEPEAKTPTTPGAP